MPHETEDNLLENARRKYAPDAPPPPPAQDWDKSFGRRHIIPFFASLLVVGILILSLTLCSVPSTNPDGRVGHPYDILERKVDSAFPPSQPPSAPAQTPTTTDVIEDAHDNAENQNPATAPPRIEPYDMRD